MEHLRISQSDIALWLFAAATGIGLCLLAPKLGADFVGRGITIVMLVALFYCLNQPMMQLNWFQRTFPKIPRWLHRTMRLPLGVRVGAGSICVAILVTILGWFVWPEVLTVRPSTVIFDSRPYANFSHQAYRFIVTNKSAEDIYIAEVDFTVEDPAKSEKDFSIYIARKPQGQNGVGAQDPTDIVGAACRDPNQNPLFIISFQRLRPQEPREITITQQTTGKVAVLAETGFYSTHAQPISINCGEGCRGFRFEKPIIPGSCKVSSTSIIRSPDSIK
jgi:hypothetical protein